MINYLIVDDEPKILDSIVRVLQPLGCEILCCTNAKNAIEILQKRHINTIVSDLKMPEIDGNELLSNVQDKWPDTVRILMTAFPTLNSIIEGINTSHIYYFLQKPWQPEDLLALVTKSFHLYPLDIEYKNWSCSDDLS